MKQLGIYFPAWNGAAFVRAFSAGGAVLLAAWLSMDFLCWLTSRGMPIDSVAMTVVLFVCAATVSLYWTVNNVLYPLVARSSGLAGPGLIVANAFAECHPDHPPRSRAPREGAGRRAPVPAPGIQSAGGSALVAESGASNSRGRQSGSATPLVARRGGRGRRAGSRRR